MGLAAVNAQAVVVTHVLVTKTVATVYSASMAYATNMSVRKETWLPAKKMMNMQAVAVF